MVRSPVVGMISTLMWSFNSASQAYLQVRHAPNRSPAAATRFYFSVPSMSLVQPVKPPQQRSSTEW